MPSRDPFVAPSGIRPPLELTLSLDSRNDLGRLTRYAWTTRVQPDPNARGGMWIKTSSRNRVYVCSVGAEHGSYWRRFQSGGNSPIDMRCKEHEIVFR
jgi:hypothetical protein